MSVNKVILIGNVGQDPKITYYEGGNCVAQLSLATTEKGYTLQNGTQIPDRTEWHNLIFRGRLGEIVEKYVHKGDKLYVEGKIRTRSYDDQGGIKRYVTEIFVDNMEMLTFDDGPTPGITEWILAMLEKYDAKATFFVLGKNVEAYPDLFRRIVDAGHKVGNHTYSHQKGWGMSLERYIEDVDFANDLIHSELFRPPYARITPAQARALSQRYKLVMWDVLSRDYSRSLSPRKCLKNVTKHLEPGAIVVFHDSEKSFRNMRYALPRTLDKIRKLGLKCKTIEL